MEAADPRATDVEALLAPLRRDPESSAVFCDIDGTLAPIVERASDAAVPAEARSVLRALAQRYAMVGCLSGRAAVDARRLVGVEELTYIGNHGFERLLPGEAESELDPALAGNERVASEFIARLDADELARLGLRTEDKGPIQALHWRGAADEEGAEAHAREIGTDAASRDLVPHWGRKVLEIRPGVHLNKGTALAELLAERRMSKALYGGDDRTDVDAFRRLRDLRAAGELELAVCIGIASEEGPPEVGEESDLLVDGPEGFFDVLRLLAA
ncbi:MAG TPA: trehalose-phosphatase [Solirubrobacterales bacterium]|nr:trehalose-phosphatase [Solirubrobacterales bacterium]